MIRYILMLSLAVGTWACDRKQVNKDQPAVQFKTDAETKLQQFESRIADLEQQKERKILTAEQVDKVENHTEIAKEFIEMLRNIALPRLLEVSDERVESVKSDVNASLLKIDRKIQEAEKIAANPPREPLPFEPYIPKQPTTIPS